MSNTHITGDLGYVHGMLCTAISALHCAANRADHARLGSKLTSPINESMNAAKSARRRVIATHRAETETDHALAMDRRERRHENKTPQTPRNT